jgi:hypothetical protein
MQETVNPIDFSGLWDISDGKKSVLIDILQSIEKGLKNYPEQISIAFEQLKAKELREITHKTKSCTNYLYHAELTILLEEIEKAAMDKNLDSFIKEKIKRVEVITQTILPDIRFHLEQLQSL